MTNSTKTAILLDKKIKMYYSIITMKNTPILPHFERTKKITKATMKKSSPFSNAKAAFNWLNVDFPYQHTHTHWEILIVTKGKALHTINNHQEIISKGYACLIRPTDSHRLEHIKNEKNIETINFTFSNEIAEALLNIYKDYPLNLHSDEPLHFSLESSLLDSITKQALIAQSTHKTVYEQFSILMVHQLFTIMLSQKLHTHTAYPDWLNDFLNHLHNPNSFEETVNQLASHTPYSYTHLARVFKQYLGKTLVEYLNEVKIIYAKRMLRATTKSILEISLDIGYNSVSSFNHHFKNLTSLTPTQYRKKYNTLSTENNSPNKC